MPVIVGNHSFALLQGEVRVLAFVDADGDDDFVDERQRAADDGGMSGGEGVERAGEDGSGHMFSVVF